VTGPSVFTIPAGADFAATLARGLLDRLGGDALKLSSAIIYLPTRRATRSFGEAFAQACGGATLLPQFRALGESDEDELLFDAAAEGLELLPAISPLRRQLRLARLIRDWSHERPLSFAQAAALADSLAKVMDEVETQGCNLGKLKELAPPELAAHWEGVTRFLDVLNGQWPAILEEERKQNPAARRNQALKALAQRLSAAPPDGFVIAAGSTGSIPATAELLGAIARLPNGAVVLPGLDRDLDAQSWADLDPGHPQFGLKQLLKTMDCAREDVRDWADSAHNSSRALLLRETLRPAPTTDAWRALAGKGAGDVTRGLEGIGFVSAADPAQEALAIALALRHALETPGRTAALVTPDRSLARRVAAEMARWNVALDDSAGRPLAHTAAGAFLCLVAEAADAQFAPVPLLALLKHPFATRGQDAATFRARARELDRWCLRGPRPDAGLAGITNAIAKAGAAHRPPPAEGLATLRAWWNDIAAILSPLENLFDNSSAAMDTLLDAHVAAAEALACGEDGECALWANDDGAVAFELVAGLKLAAQNQPDIEPGSWAALFRSLAMKAPVRTGIGRHPRLAILGPLEARLQRFDLTILGGLNEGTWPGAAGHDPWFSRPMRASLGLEQPERSIGLSAHDFAMLAAGPQVLLTRAEKAQGAKTIASRWLRRLEQLVAGLMDTDRGLDQIIRPDPDYAALAAQLVTVRDVDRIRRPAPRPPVKDRPRQLSVTEIETWLRDPYAIYARHVLRLRPLEPLNDEVGPLERGTALHAAVEEFVRRHPAALPADAAEQLAALADGIFDQLGIPKAAQAVWRPRFLDAARGFIEVERARRADIVTPHVEKLGRLVIDAPGGDFTLTGRADRIDILRDGTATIVDYKSGTPPSVDQVKAMLAPQLPLEAAMLEQDGFGIGRFIAEQLLYISLADGRKARGAEPIAGGAALAAEALLRLKGRIARFDDPDTAYHPRVLPFSVRSEGDYDHLARVKEWSATTEEA
jgi:ATP-dependent helicase/nuclease subunit B